MENFEILKNKLKTSKSNLSKSITKCGEEFIKFEKSKNGGPKKRQERCADYSLVSLEAVREKLAIMRSAKYDDLIQQAEAILNGQDQTTEQVQAAAAGKSSWRAFKPQAASSLPTWRRRALTWRFPISVSSSMLT